MKIVIVLLLFTLTGFNCKRLGPTRDILNEIFAWDLHEFQFPPNRREQAIASGSFIPGKNGISTIGLWRGKLFAGIFRFTKGVVSSLNYISLNTTERSPVLIPYPSFEDNYINEDPNNLTVSSPSQSSIINPGHFAIDKCNRLWVADSGYSDHYEEKRQIAPPAIIIFDLTTDTFISRIDVPKHFINPFSFLAKIVIDFSSDSCEDVHAYVSDFFRSIIVYSYKTGRMWQVEHNFMGSDPHEGNFVYSNINFQWNYGIDALALSDVQSDGSKIVYFAPVSSTKVYYVSNRVLQDENYTLGKYYYDFHLIGENGIGGHTNQMVYDERTGILFSTMFEGATIVCWNTRLPFQSNTVHKTNTNIDFYPTDLDIDADGNLWVVSSLVALTSYAEFQPGVKNVRIFNVIAEQAVAGTNCKAQKSNSS